ncbi:MAG: sigma-54 dependent transcriptional regulator [Pseudomonadota bacterium]
MQKKQLLWVALDGLSIRPQANPEWAGWEVLAVASLHEAGQVLRARAFLVGVLMGRGGEEAYDEIGRFLHQHWRMQWVGVFQPGALNYPACRRLVADHLCDFHTLPVDALRLRHTLGHAHGCATLMQACETPPAAPDNGLKGQGVAITRLRRQIAKVAAASAPVLIWGESGSGKELTAQAIHASSARAAGPFVPINCGAMPASLIQAELFGYERGAFTGAARDKRGLIETAAGGTIFLDEIGDFPLELQSNLLRFLQEKTIYRLGGTDPIAVDVRVIAASHVDLGAAAAAGSFREDLYYRLNVLALDVPPLRARKDDLILLANHFFSLFAQERAAHVKGLSSRALHAIKQHDWPGNVRELINRIRRAMVMAEGKLITPHDLGLPTRTSLAGARAYGAPGAGVADGDASCVEASGVEASGVEASGVEASGVEAPGLGAHGAHAPDGTGFDGTAFGRAAPGRAAPGRAAPGRAALEGARLRAERDAICASLTQHGNNVTRAARGLGVSRMTLYRLLAKHQLSGPGRRPVSARPAATTRARG